MVKRDEAGINGYQELTSSASGAVLIDKIYENSLKNADEEVSEIRAKEAIKQYKEHKKTHRRIINQRLKVLRRCISKKYIQPLGSYFTSNPWIPGKVKVESKLETSLQ